jgi:serine protease
MNKKLISALVAITLAIPTISANAASLQNKTVAQPTIAILDTAIDTSLPIFKDRILFEACVTQFSTCPNGMSEMEGTNSAIMPADQLSRNGFDHGTQMASLAVAANPNVKIVFVRIIGSNPNGTRQVAGEPTVVNGLDWVLRNKDRFNIQAVSMSQAHHNLGPAGTDYCPKTPLTEGKVKALADAGVPVFFPAGNNRDYVRIDWPACIQSSIAIGAVMPTNEIAIYSNFDSKLVDFFALGTTRATAPGGKVVNVGGTSAATVIAATQWATIKAAKPTLTYTQIYDLISATSIPTKNSRVSGGKLINLTGALSVN